VYTHTITLWLLAPLAQLVGGLYQLLNNPSWDNTTFNTLFKSGFVGLLGAPKLLTRAGVPFIFGTKPLGVFYFWAFLRSGGKPLFEPLFWALWGGVLPRFFWAFLGGAVFHTFGFLTPPVDPVP